MSISRNIVQQSVTTGTQGKFQITINGFTVNHESWDDALQWDGKEDEIFICSEVRLIDASGTPLLKTMNRSKVMGDMNNFPDRIQAGSASSKGGLRTGDRIPSHTPWQRVGTLQPDRLPMLVCEVELVQGQHALGVAPSLWEWDGGGDIFNDFLDAIATNGPAIIQAPIPIITGGQLPQPVVDGLQKGFPAVRAVLDALTGRKGDRPLGMVQKGDHFEFTPQVLVLNFETADFVAKNNLSGLGNGVLGLTYKDDSKLQGDYSLYLQVLRLT